MIESYSNKASAEMESAAQSLTIKPNSVVVIKVSQKYDVSDLDTLRDYFRAIFPNNTICVIWNDIEIEIVHDESWKKSRPCAEVNDGYPSYI